MVIMIELKGEFTQTFQWCEALCSVFWFREPERQNPGYNVHMTLILQIQIKSHLYSVLDKWLIMYKVQATEVYHT